MNKKILVTVLSAASIVGVSHLATHDSFAGDFQKKHPRRAQVLKRDKNEIKKNNAAATDGKITQDQANKLNKEDAAIRRQEQADAAANGGHITKGEQRDLNREENRVNRQRNHMEARDAANNNRPAPVSAPATTN